MRTMTTGESGRVQGGILLDDFHLRQNYFRGLKVGTAIVLGLALAIPALKWFFRD